MKKLVLTIIFSSFLSVIFAQDFKLTEPNILKLKDQILNEDNSETIIKYLTNNYKTKSQKSNLQYYEWEKTKLCGFTQDFENGIKYSVFECKEAGGITIELELPKIERKELMKWIEKIYEVNKMESNENIWKEGNSKFEPKESDPGCYFKITERKKTTFIELYCGC